MQMVLTGAVNGGELRSGHRQAAWTIDGPTEQFVASMVYSKGLFFLTAGFPTYHVMGIKPDGTGNVTKSHVAWHVEKGGAGLRAEPGRHGDNIFLVHDEGLRDLPRRADRQAALGRATRQASQRLAEVLAR